jgi:general secretion pathway protein I
MNRFRSLAAARRARGFSLIEMVAAFLVFAIGIGVLMRILAGSMHSARQSEGYTMAALWAESKLDTVGVGEPVEAGRSSGRFDDTYAWDLEITQVDPSSVEPPPQQSAAGNQNAAGAVPQATSVANAGLGGGIQAQPFDLYQVDLVVSWGGRTGANVHRAHFGTLRAVNPAPDQAAAGNGAMQVVPARR